MADSQNQAAALKPEQILEITIRRRWLIMVPLCIFLTLGFLHTLTSNKIYEASTTILIQPQRVPSNYVQSIVTTDIVQRINTISQQILSRTNLEKIIKKFGLYQDNEEMYTEDKVIGMRNRVVVTESTTRTRGLDAFTISFTGSNPEIVEDVVNELANFFMNENLKARESQAIGTSEFLESELDKIKKKLEDREQILAVYRSQHLGGLPDELETNLRTLDRLQLQHTDSLTALRDVQNAVARLKNQISRLREMAQSNTTATIQQDGTIVESSTLSISEQQYEVDKRQLDDLLLKYTEKHPEVIRLTKNIEKIKIKIQEEKKEETRQNLAQATQTPEGSYAASATNNILSQHEYNLKQLESDIFNLKANIREIEKTTIVYQKRVEDTPKREQELQSIQRDYNNIRASYSSLLARRLEAELAVNMEKKQKGEQFRIIDYARLPEKPISPNVKKLFIFSIAIGLGIGGGIIFLLESFNPAIRSERQIETGLGLPILASIPPLAQPGDNIKKWIERICFSIVSFYAVVVLLSFVLLNLLGINKILDFVKMYINI